MNTSARRIFTVALLVLATLGSNTSRAQQKVDPFMVGRDTMTTYTTHLGRFVKTFSSGNRLAVMDFENFRVIIYERGATLSSNIPLKVLGEHSAVSNKASYAASGRFSSEYSGAFWKDTLYVSNYGFGEVIRFTRDGDYIDSKPGKFLMIQADTLRLCAFSGDSIFVRNESTGAFTFAAKIPGGTSITSDTYFSNIRVGADRIAVKGDTVATIYNLTAVLAGGSPAPLFSVSSPLMRDASFTSQRFVWATAYAGEYASVDLDGNNKTTGDFQVYEGYQAYSDGRLYVCGNSKFALYDASLQLDNRISHGLAYVNFTLLGADNTNFYFYNGATGGLAVTPVDLPSGKYTIDLKRKIPLAVSMKLFRNAQTFKVTLSTADPDSPYVNIFNIDSMTYHRFRTLKAAGIDVIGDTIVVLSGNRIHHYLHTGTLLSTITLPITDTAGAVSFAANATRFFYHASGKVNIFRRDGTRDTVYTMTAYNPAVLTADQTTLACNTPASRMTIATGVVTTMGGGVAWGGFQAPTRYWYKNVLPNTYFASTDGFTSVAEAPAELPTTLALDQNYPNPFNPSTTIVVQNAGTTASRHLNLTVYDVLGRKVAVLMDGVFAPGTYPVRFAAQGLASGVYLYQLTTGTESLTRRMLLMR